MKTIGAEGMEDISTDGVFAGKKVAVFGLPGAFTKTCSAKHLPGFVQNADALMAKGIDAILCISVNDAFVMNAWGQRHGAPGKVIMVGDGNAAFAKAIGLDQDLSARAMGIRAQRYSMIVDDGVVQDLQIDGKGEYGSTSAETMLENL